MGVIQKMTEEQVDEMFQLAAYAFNAETTDKRKERFKEIVKHSWNYGCFSENDLANQVISTPFNVAFHGVNYQMAGIGCVSSYPEYRGQGGISAIMKQLLAELAENKVELAYLAPFSHPFYRNYGFEQLFEQISYTIKAADWPNIRAVPGNMRRVSFEEAKSVCQSIYSVLPKNQRGAVVRQSWWLDYSFGMEQGNQFALYEDEHGNPKGYLIYKSSKEQFVVKEWGYLTGLAFRSILRFIGSHNGSSQEFYYETGFDGQNLSYLMPEPVLEMKISPYMMGRIVDLESFLTKYPFQPGKEACYYLKVEDTYGPWNEGVWEVKINEKGKCIAKKVSQIIGKQKEEAVITSTIQSWTQLFMGYRTISDISFYGKLSGKADLIESLEQRLVKGMPVLEDYF
ncbi:GNAT family N-acetyltransferase [Candidatus Enterococcus mansonii]|uniref:N-acetyltransferase domain-containing protein n=1 Tax=Candidatus Enterococcus mansonii TaxID=1834181 RepID=A0A242CHS7_9ENTE|nr:GNAT family N-acetyltransferase [Enterococcus sp. 4G2_DIV0659]OTO09719.1 hypothetical protein A5880_000399 [Enterococcus sp. 4G2_DIV0659]